MVRPLSASFWRHTGQTKGCLRNRNLPRLKNSTRSLRQPVVNVLRAGREDPEVSAVGVGVGIGLLLDYWLETKPWLMVVFFLLGSAAGFLNIFRTMSGYGYAAGYDANNADNKPARNGSE